MAKILVIDDDQDTLDFVAICLDDLYDVVSTLSGEGGLRLVEQTDFDVVLTDIFMPKTDGLEVVQALTRKIPPTKIIVMTSESKGGKTDYLSVAMHMGAAAKLSKPFTPEQVRKVVSDVLGG